MESNAEAEVQPLGDPRNVISDDPATLRAALGVACSKAEEQARAAKQAQRAAEHSRAELEAVLEQNEELLHRSEALEREARDLRARVRAMRNSQPHLMTGQMELQGPPSARQAVRQYAEPSLEERLAAAEADRDEAVREMHEALQAAQETEAAAKKYGDMVTSLHSQLTELQQQWLVLTEAAEELQCSLHAEQEMNQRLCGKIKERDAIIESLRNGEEQGGLGVGPGSGLADELRCRVSSPDSSPRVSQLEHQLAEVEEDEQEAGHAVCETGGRRSKLSIRKVQKLQVGFAQTFEAFEEALKQLPANGEHPLLEDIDPESGVSRSQLENVWHQFQTGSFDAWREEKSKAPAEALLEVPNCLSCGGEGCSLCRQRRAAEGRCAGGVRVKLLSSKSVDGITWYLFWVAEHGREDRYYLKRYTDFVRLDQAIRTSGAYQLHRVLQELPESGLFGLRHKLGIGDFNEKRRQGLQAYVDSLVSQVSALSEEPILDGFFHKHSCLRRLSGSLGKEEGGAEEQLGSLAAFLVAAH